MSFLTMETWAISGDYDKMFIKFAWQFFFDILPITVSVAGFEMILRRHISHYLITYYLPSGEAVFSCCHICNIMLIVILGRFICGCVLDKLRCTPGCYSWQDGSSYNPLPCPR